MKTIKCPDPVRFRAQCTGIGSTSKASERTGMNRSQEVIDAAPPAQRKHAVGYPAPTPADYAMCEPGMVYRQSTLRR